MKAFKLGLDEDFVFSKQFEHPLDPVLKVLLKDVQSDKQCVNKIPMVEIKDTSSNEVFYLVSRRRLREVTTKRANKDQKLIQKNLLIATGYK